MIEQRSLLHRKTQSASKNKSRFSKVEKFVTKKFKRDSACILKKCLDNEYKRGEWRVSGVAFRVLRSEG